MTVGAPIELLTALVAFVAEEDDDRRVPWLRALPDVVRDVAARWPLELGRPFQPGGTSSWVAPVRDAEGRELVLQVGSVHVEAEREPRLGWRTSRARQDEERGHQCGDGPRHAVVRRGSPRPG